MIERAIAAGMKEKPSPYSPALHNKHRFRPFLRKIKNPAQQLVSSGVFRVRCSWGRRHGLIFSNTGIVST